MSATNETPPPEPNATNNEISATPPPAPATPAPPSDDWRLRAENAERELALRAALAAIDWFDPADALRELAPLAQRDADGNWTVALPPGTSSLKSQVASLSDAVRALAARKPHWVRARILGGSGAGDGLAGPLGSAAGLTYADLLKPENKDKLAEFVHDRPDELERLRQAHFKQK